MIPQSCPLSDKGKLHVTLHVECWFIREGQEPFTVMCKGCSFNPEVIREKTMTYYSADYKRAWECYMKYLGILE